MKITKNRITRPPQVDIKDLLKVDFDARVKYRNHRIIKPYEERRNTGLISEL